MTDEEREENVRRDQKRFEIGKEISEKKRSLRTRIIRLSSATRLP